MPTIKPVAMQIQKNTPRDRTQELLVDIASYVRRRQIKKERATTLYLLQSPSYPNTARGVDNNNTHNQAIVLVIYESLRIPGGWHTKMTMTFSTFYSLIQIFHAKPINKGWYG